MAPELPVGHPDRCAPPPAPSADQHPRPNRAWRRWQPCRADHGGMTDQPTQRRFPTRPHGRQTYRWTAGRAAFSSAPSWCSRRRPPRWAGPAPRGETTRPTSQRP